MKQGIPPSPPKDGARPDDSKKAVRRSGQHTNDSPVKIDPPSPYPGEPNDSLWNRWLAKRAEVATTYFTPEAQHQIFQAPFRPLEAKLSDPNVPAGQGGPTVGVSINQHPAFFPSADPLLRHEYTHFFDTREGQPWGQGRNPEFQQLSTQQDSGWVTVNPGVQTYEQWLIENDPAHLYTYWQQLSPRDIPPDLRQFYPQYTPGAMGVTPPRPPAQTPGKHWELVQDPTGPKWIEVRNDRVRPQ
jgi:hypothetical protein